MVEAVALLENLNRRGVRLTANPPKLIAEPSHLLTDADRREIRRYKPELLALLADESGPATAGLTPAQSIIETCRAYGVALGIDPANGDLVVGKAGAKADQPSQPWPSLLRAIEAHLEEVAALVEAGWTLRADFGNEANA